MKEIARLLGMTKSQLYHFRVKHGIECAKTVTDDELRERMRDCIVRSNGKFGSKATHGQLRADGIKVDIKRVCKMMREIDPEGVELRKGKPIKRRQYSVAEGI